jgi:hypothetical protein
MEKEGGREPVIWIEWEHIIMADFLEEPGVWTRHSRKGCGNRREERSRRGDHMMAPAWRYNLLISLARKS